MTNDEHKENGTWTILDDQDTRSTTGRRSSNELY